MMTMRSGSTGVSVIVGVFVDVLVRVGVGVLVSVAVGVLVAVLMVVAAFPIARKVGRPLNAFVIGFAVSGCIPIGIGIVWSGLCLGAGMKTGVIYGAGFLHGLGYLVLGAGLVLGALVGGIALMVKSW